MIIKRLSVSVQRCLFLEEGLTDNQLISFEKNAGICRSSGGACARLFNMPFSSLSIGDSRRNTNGKVTVPRTSKQIQRATLLVTIR
jgi:hypothetical protein